MLAATMLLVASSRAAAETVPLPSGAATGSSKSATLESASCPSTGDCVAVGNYLDSGNRWEGLIETETGGVWSAVEAPTAGLGASYTDLSDVSCPSAGNCVAIGSYDNASNSQQALVETESGGVWSGGQLSLTGIGYNGVELDFNAVTCPSVEDCVAVGDYATTSGEQAFVASDSGGTWTVSQVNMSGLGAGADPSAGLAAVSCAAAGSCAAVGAYVDSSNHDQGLIDTQTNGAWTASKPKLSALSSVATNPSLALTSVSCPSAGDCTAVGRYTDASPPEGSWQGLVLSSTGGVWANAAEFKLPADAGTTNGSHPAQPDLAIDSVSCSSPGNCMAVGSYDATSANLEDALELTEANGSWATGVALTPPAGANTPDADEQLNSVVCLTQGPCTMLGTYANSGGFTNAWVVSQQGAAASAASVELTAAQTNGTAMLACSPSDYCAAAGSLSSSNFPFLLDPPDAPTSPSASVGGTQAQVAWTAPGDTGGLPITDYSTTANDLTSADRGGQTQAVGTTGGPSFSGLTPGDDYTFTITPISALGHGIPVTTASVRVPPAVSVMVPWSNAQLLASLSGLLAPKGTPSHLKDLRKSHGYTFSWTPLESGTVTVGWYHLTGHGKHEHQRLVGFGSAISAGTTAISVHIKLTTLGRRLVKRSHKLKLTATVTFVSGMIRVTKTHSFTLH